NSGADYAAVRAVVRSAISRGIEVMGIYEGYKGLITDNLVPLGNRDVSNIICKSGTALYSDRCLEFKTKEGMDKAIATCKKYGIDGIVAVGGDGTFRGATDLSNHGIPSIGIPGSIDNDITSTDYCIGFDTAMNTVIEMVDRLRDTCESHARCNVVEVMGRGAGYIALEAGIAVGATAIAIPEVPFDEDAAIKRIIECKNDGKRSFLVLVAEGLGGEFAEKLTKTIQEKTGVESKFCRLAHVVRGGSPTLRDRLTATRMGDKAIDMLLSGESNLVVCERKGELVSMDINFALTLDRMYKGKLKDGDLDKYSAEDIKKMEALCEERKAYIKDLCDVSDTVAR
ncbi:MAG: ATP-dependent 6-phosphofructokinase, partial [Ruminococcaceae bacterium]|nr:ATP-dependent 6-phosphofructokinase [Oscillospiraceae bacterium]